MSLPTWQEVAVCGPEAGDSCYRLNLQSQFCCCLVAQSCGLSAVPWTEACQTTLSMGFPRQECWSGLPFPSPKSQFTQHMVGITIFHLRITHLSLLVSKWKMMLCLWRDRKYVQLMFLWVTLLNSLYVRVTFWTFSLCYFRFYLKVAVNAHTSPVQTSASHIVLSAGTSVFFVLTDALLCLIRDVTFHWVVVTFLLCHGRCFVRTGLRSTTETRASGHVVLVKLAVMVSAGS